MCKQDLACLGYVELEILNGIVIGFIIDWIRYFDSNNNHYYKAYKYWRIRNKW